MRRRGLTLVEVLVALTLFALLAASTAGLQAAALRLARRAELTRDVTGALEPLTVPARIRDPGWDPCAPGPELRACEVRRSACCGSGEALERVEVAWTFHHGEAVTLRLLARTGP